MGNQRTSEQATSEVIDRWFAAWNAHDADAIAACLTQDVVHEDPGAPKGVYRGHDAGPPDQAVREGCMATGTSAGLLDSSDRAQSVFKHAIIRHYMVPFLAMTGSTSQDRRVVVMDGFAGRGRYPDGTPASAELIMQAVRGLQGSRTVATFFVENDPKQFRELDMVVSEYAAQGLEAEALPGSADDHLDQVIESARGVPFVSVP